MKTPKIFFTLTILSCIFLSCKKKSDTTSPEPYSSYISIEISKPLTFGSDTEKIIQIYLKNDSNKEFEKECIMSYSLQDSISGDYYHSESLFSNKQVPNSPKSVLNVQKKGSLFFNINLRNLKWTNLDFENIKPNQYLLNLQLFIRDPYSPMNLIQSNKVTIIK